MDYNLNALSTRQFEQLTQSLLLKSFGPAVSLYGDGPDGGREATWDGRVAALHGSDEWDGYGVLQAKMRLRPTSPADNLIWLKSQVREELDAWADPTKKRTKKPEYLIFATNVVLSADPRGGKDAINDYITKKLDELEIKVKQFLVLSYGEICGLLDDAPGIRHSYAALITPGDIVAQILKEHTDGDEEFALALRAHAARGLRDDTYLNLSQTGTVKDQQVTVAEVFVDLPLLERGAPAEFFIEPSESPGPRGRKNIVRALVERFDTATGAQEEKSTSLKQVVVIGGPGQGKSTATQFLAQMYRARFLEGSPVEDDPELTPALQPLRERLEALRIDGPRARRWPVRILLTDLADSLAEQRCNSLLDYIAQAVSYRSSVGVETKQMRKWLRAYPWLLMVDGLDEVPNSSNRAQVLACIRDFFHDVRLLDADVAIVATTRPQGYDDDFNPEHYSHLNLASLPMNVALSYAQGFIAVRAGDGTSKASRIYDRLVKASKDETTARLFSSPLQVTILTVLIEKLGRVPQDRWRLFSQYYNVISQRELEKGGELSDLLQTYENDVEYLHRYIGHLLQERAAEAGETSSTISKEEFHQIISERLSLQGHTPNEVARLAGEFLRLATHRLVFLAFVQADRVGFEIRSLQEYMSAWHLVSGPESEIIAAITKKALEPYWRNVVLFAVGSIFTSKDHLKADVLNMCIEIDLMNSAFSALRPGSILAIDILLDGSCHAQPAYARPLSDRASKLIDGPFQPRVTDFSKFSGSEVADIFRAEVLKVSPTTAHAWANRAIALDAMCANDLASDVELHAVVSAASRSGVQAILELIGSGAYRYVASVIEARAGDFSPRHILESFPRRHSVDFYNESGLFPEWIIPLLQIAPNYGEGLSFAKESMKDLISHSVTPVSENLAAWTSLSESEFKHPSWKMLKQIGDFVLSPSKELLACALEAISRAPEEDYELLQTAPWVIAACHEAAVRFSPYFVGDSASNAFEYLAIAARSGHLGDEMDWKSAETRWQNSSDLSVQDFLFVDSLCDGGHLPFTTEVGSRGAVAFGTSMSVRHASGSESHNQMTEALAYAQLVPKTTCPMQAASLVNTVSFLTSVVLMSSEDDFDAVRNSSEAKQIFEILVKAVADLRDGSPVWLGWLAAAPAAWGMSEAGRKTVMHLTRLHLTGQIYADSGTGLQWVDELGVSPEALLLRVLIGLAYNPDQIHRFSGEDFSMISALRHRSIQVELLMALFATLSCEISEISTGVVDDQLKQLLLSPSRRGAFSFDLGLAVLETQDLERRQAILVRVLEIFSEIAPTRVTKVLEVLA